MLDRPLQQLNTFERCLVVFWEYIKISSVVVGGGYAIIAASQQVFVKKREWLNDENILDMVVITQAVPGILATNTAIYIGYKVAGLAGAISAMIGSALPSIIIIIIIAAGLSNVPLDNPHVRGAMIGVVSGVVSMVLLAAFRLRKKAFTGKVSILIAMFALAGMVVLKISPLLIMSLAVLAGIVDVYMMRKRMKS